MRCYQLIYTKVPKEESPRGKADFHTVFYPVALLQEEDLQEIEKRIHYPGERFPEKKAVFFLRIKDEHYLVILCFKTLPEARDSFGRRGIFLCQGFLFSKEIWSKSPRLLSLLELVNDAIFPDREAVLVSPRVNKQTGDIQPIEIPSEKLSIISDRLPRLESDFEWRMVIFLNRLANMGPNHPAVLLQGAQEDVSIFMDKLSAYVPDELKINIGFDSALDGGVLSFFPLKIAGYSESRPSGAVAVKIDLAQRTIEQVGERIQLTMPVTPYEHWLFNCRQEVINKEQQERAFYLSRLVEQNIAIPENRVLTNRKCFALANAEIIKSSFRQRVQEFTGNRVAVGLCQTLTPDTMLDLLIERLPPAKLAGYIEDIIIKERIQAQEISISPSVVESGSNRLKILVKAGEGKVIRPDELNGLEKNQQLELIKYFVSTDFLGKEWLISFLKTDEPSFNYLWATTETRVIIEEYLKEQVFRNRELRGIAEIIYQEAINQGRTFELFQNRINIIEIIKESLNNRKWTREDLKKLLSWAKKREPEITEMATKLLAQYKEATPKEYQEKKMGFIKKIKDFLSFRPKNKGR